MLKLKKVYIEITNVCNLSCDFCPETKRRAEFMSAETFCKILDQIKPHTDYIYLHVKGEPLLHPKLGDFLDLSYEKGFHVNITTNGTLIHKAGDMLLGKPALRQVNFSLHSFDGNADSQGKTDLQGKTDSQGKDEYIKNILRFTKKAMKESGIIVSLRLWNLSGNLSGNLSENRSENRSANHADNTERKINNALLNAIEKEFDLPYKIQEEVVAGRGIKIADRLYVNQDHQFVWPDLKEEEDAGKGFCYGLRSQAAILVDGTVVPCCLDGEGVINLGNIHAVPFSDIIDSRRAREITDGFARKEAVEELCRKCGYRKRFG